MRTLKKTLCLVLALAMMVGLCAVGASAITVNDYKDKDQIPNMEAFATLTAIGVFQGDDTGNVNPTASLTRAEGATVITKMHATSGSGTSSFTDMATAAWAQPAVAYCEANGIINGYGDGTFGPSDPLSTVAFAKMCVTSLGYDATIEGLTGSQWEINTIKLVNSLDLAYGIANPDWNGACPRWVAAQLAFNTLTKTMQEYKGGTNVDVKTGDGTDVHVAENATPYPVENNSYDYMNRASYEDGEMQFCEQFFPNLKLKTGGSNAWGEPTNYWYMGDNRKDAILTTAKQITSELAGTVVATYATGFEPYATAKEIYTATLASEGVSTKLHVFENGKPAADIEVLRTDGASRPFAKYAGATITLIDTSEEGDKTVGGFGGFGIADTVIVKYPVLATVTAVNPATKSASRSVTLSVNTAKDDAAKTTYPTGYDGSAVARSLELTTEKYVKYDKVLIYPSMLMADLYDGTTDPINTKVYRVLKDVQPESVNGKLSKVNLAGTNATGLTLDGVAYSLAGSDLSTGGPTTGKTVTGSEYALGTGYTAYLSNGFVMGAASDAEVYKDYVFVLATAPSSTVLTSTKIAGILKQDATTAEVTMSSKSTGLKTTGTGNTEQMLWAKATESGKETRLDAPAAAKASTVKVTTKKLSPDTPSITSGGYTVTFDSKTTFILHDKDGNYSTVTGLAKLGKYESTTDMTLYALVPANRNAVAVYVELGANAAPVGQVSKMIYVISTAPGSEELGTDGYIYNYSAFVDGQFTSTLQSADNTLAAAGLVVPTYDGKGFVTKVEAGKSWTGNVTDGTVRIAKGAATKIAYANENLTCYMNGTDCVFAVNPDAAVYVYDTVNRESRITTVDAIPAAGTLSAVATSTTNGVIKEIYIEVA